MAGTSRDRMVDSTIKLLAQHGFQGASFSSVLEDSGAPRGSIYHHFPGGKNELVLEALDRSGARASSIVGNLRGQPADAIIRVFVGLWRSLLLASDFSAGCSVLGVTVSSDEPEILHRAAGIFRSWHTELADVLTAGGLEKMSADQVATLTIAACEGAVVLCRAEHTTQPLDEVETALLQTIGVMTSSRCVTGLTHSTASAPPIWKESSDDDTH